MPRNYQKEYAELADFFKQASANAVSPEDRTAARRDYDEAVRELALEQQAESRASRMAEPATPSMTGRQRAVGTARAAAQGATFGLGEEAEALVRSLSPERTYQEEVSRIRGEMGAFREAYPKTAMGAEFVGGALVPGAVGFRALQATGKAGRALRTAAGQGAVQGALAGAGTTEGGVKERALGAIAGGAAGGALGGAVGGVGRLGAQVAQRGLRFVPAGTSAVARAMEKANVSAEELAQRAANAPEGATIADIIGDPAIRTLRAIRSAGGAAGARVESEMAERMATSPDRLLRQMYGSRVPENIVQATEESIKRGKRLSAPFYEAFERMKPKEVPYVDSVMNRPIVQKAIERARMNAANEGREFMEPAQAATAGRVLDALGRPVMQKARAAKYPPKTLDDIKKAMDELIYEGKYGNVTPGQGGITPGEASRLKDIRRNFIDAVDEAFPDTYAEARAEWAGEFAIRDALLEGVEAGKKAGTSLTPEMLAKTVREYSGTNLEEFQRGYIDQLRQRVEAGGIGPKEIQAPIFAKRIMAVFGPDEGGRIIDAFRSEAGLRASAQKITGGSQTAEKLMDAVELGDMDLTSALGIGGLSRLKFAAGREVARRAQAPMLAGRREQAAEALLSRPDEIRGIIDALTKERNIQRRARAVGLLSAGAVGREIAGNIARASNQQRSGY
jgi:hypothetical protein